MPVFEVLDGLYRGYKLVKDLKRDFEDLQATLVDINVQSIV